MQSNNEAIITLPLFIERIWGSRGLEIYGLHPAQTGSFGELWSVSGLPENDTSCYYLNTAQNTLGTSPDKFSIPLNTLYREKQNTIWPGKDAHFPLLIKIIQASQNLSIQVHPSHATAPLGQSGKNEAWIILNCHPGAEIVYGFKKHVTPQIMKNAIKDDSIMSLVRTITVKPGDIFYIPAGTVHSLGAGITVAEIQTASDLTYRLFDYNRRDESGQPRPLHVEQALSVIDWEINCTNLPLTLGSDSWITTPDFQFSHRTWNSSQDLTGPLIITVLNGCMSLINNPQSNFFLHPGKSVILPPSISACLNGKGHILLTRPPSVSF